MMEVHGEDDTASISFPEFLEMFDDLDWGFGIMNTLVKLEAGDRVRHGRLTCAVCSYPIIGPRFKEVNSRFSLCSICYSEGKVPVAFKQEEYRFKEYGSETEAMCILMVHYITCNTNTKMHVHRLHIDMFMQDQSQLTYQSNTLAVINA